jgi:hypothetical protein
MFYINIITLLIYLAIIIPASALAASSYVPFVKTEPLVTPLDPFKPPPNTWGPSETPFPENYIEPTVNYALDLIIPKSYRRALDFRSGYDRYVGLPTLTADYLLSTKSWNGSSLFLSPRASLASRSESFSIAGGTRRLVHDSALLGFYGFHDWVRPRGSDARFLQQTGFGMELHALPGRQTDLTLSANVYLPVNERLVISAAGDSLIREALSTGLDGRLDLLLPPIVDWMEARLTGKSHLFWGDRTEVSGYTFGLSVNTRDGMLRFTLEQGKERGKPDQFKAEGNLSMAFDWERLLKGKNPFSAPFKASPNRFTRDLRDSMQQRAVRKHDLPTDRSERRNILAAMVDDDAVIFSGGFPGLAGEPVTVQTAMSPWQDRIEVSTDSDGSYSGRLRLAPGTYSFRLIHKASGRVSEVKTIRIEAKREPVDGDEAHRAE